MKKLFLIPLMTVVVIGFMAGVGVAAVDHTKFQDTEQCLTCHEEDITVERDGVSISLDVDKKSYDASVHGTVACISCHDFSGGLVYGDDLNAKVSEKCVTCHTGAGFDYGRSVHSETAEGPNCVDCHGSSHEIEPVTAVNSPVHGINQSDTCGDCHQQAKEQFKESFHGKAVVLGSPNSPDCTDCHGAHQVLSKDNPVSLTSEERKTSLCARCHEGNTLGANDVEHYTMKSSGFGMPMYWVKKFFMWLILLVVGFFLVHILLDLAHKMRSGKSY